ncbi:hypothetical protein V1525DRAFT_406969 [Lipomyces kononenkoae]|uniref:Uncharacterized protein n=1 Tax=Lipomyces kononenkoae TaxID=34357 RepID=A0ACC3SYP4_LIPKO
MRGSSFSAKTPTADLSNPFLQRLSLFSLVLQNSLLILTLHYSRVQNTTPGERYFASTAVLLVEVVKLIVSLCLTTYEISRTRQANAASDLRTLVFRSLFSKGSWRLILPAALYTLQNSLLYVAISNLEVVTFQVTYQLKILTTVLFSILLLGKTISSRQWLALMLLVAGVVVVQVSGPLTAQGFTIDEIKSKILSLMLPNFDPGVSARRAARGADASGTGPLRGAGSFMDPMVGLLAVLAAAIVSGLTCVYFEKLVKDSLASVSLWTRNAQLAFFSIFPALFIGVLWQDGEQIARDGFFRGYSSIVWVTIALQASGGIIVAMCMTYADNVAKTFATSLSIVVSGMMSAILFGTPVMLSSTVGTATVLVAIYLYQSTGRVSTVSILPLSKEPVFQGSETKGRYMGGDKAT